MQQDCRSVATMTQSPTLALDMDSDGQEVRSGFWRFAAPEYYTLAIIISVAIATYIFVTGDAQSERLLTPALVAAIMVVNLVPAMALIVLIGSRVARARAVRSMAGGNGRLHVRLVALFSLIAAAPTLLVVIFASLLFQFGVDFWFSDRSRGMFENAANLAEGYYQENQRQVGANTYAMATDLGKQLSLVPIDSPAFSNYYLQQVVVRSLNESAIIEIGRDGVARTATAINPDDRAAEARLGSAMVGRLDAGEDVVVVRQPTRIEAAARLPGTDRAYVYASRDTNVPGFQQSARASAVLADYNSLFDRSQQLQLQFNGALYLGSLLLLALAVIAAIVVADRIVRPLGTLIGATRTAAGGDLSVRVTPPARDDEIAVLTRAFNRMTEQLQGQTGALVSVNEQLEARRSFIEAVLSGVSSAVVSVDADHRILLANAAAERLICQSAECLTGQPLDDVAPELARLLISDEREAIVQLSRKDAEPATLAAKAVAQGDGFVLSFEDITQQLLDQRRAAWSDVARRIAHEIKNPLTPIQLAAERLQRRFGDKVEGDSATFRKLTDTVIRQVHDMRRMVDEFSSFARMPKPTFGVEDVRDILRQTVFLFEVAKPDIAFAVKTPAEIEPLVCDRRLLSQAMTNIVKNAVEAIEEKYKNSDAPVTGHVAAELFSGADGEIVIRVSDDGIGLPEARDAIAEPYMTTRQGGTGLGLAIVKKIVEQHYGELEFSDNPAGQGTCVTLTLHPDRLRPLAGKGGEQGMGHSESVPGRIRNRQDREDHGA
ncbi:PAS domain-containing sensor histidine kinase [Sphingopyxis sp. H038]|nr:PAS domain-containing sensor histidine kinase [Sphingopyxis sp. H012]KTE10356.1 PAS domain-containing sensor histidine kinase [Sphingopyxis sp. H053]KTE14718.1 PAS domain-containing sensor histidine kinase [Sphingopyxis sp. H093]KTE28962.1 PAS domain-containing sensor histidine kinase [Sphingopyxis sp. H080]KTE35960.1 PAS domain-containing sensor histidine kinase [Sphingopyxis sp. H038]KTE44805.1 PAS domain-containing sensor histidine kinase [Sphingopyxis sp. H005]KTE47605.1 PAS domain-con